MEDVQKENVALKAEVAKLQAEISALKSGGGASAGAAEKKEKKAAAAGAGTAKPAGSKRSAVEEKKKKSATGPNPVKLGKKPLEGTAKKQKGAPASVAGQTSKLTNVAMIVGDRVSSSDGNLQAAHKACDAINRPFIHELAIMATPPQPVVDVMVAMGKAMGVPVDSWKEGKAIVKDPKLLTVLIKFDYDKNECKGLDKAVANLDPKKIEGTSRAAALLAVWCLAVNSYKKGKAGGGGAAAPTEAKA